MKYKSIKSSTKQLNSIYQVEYIDEEKIHSWEDLINLSPEWVFTVRKDHGREEVIEKVVLVDEYELDPGSVEDWDDFFGHWFYAIVERVVYQVRLNINTEEDVVVVRFYHKEGTIYLLKDKGLEVVGIKTTKQINSNSGRATINPSFSIISQMSSDENYISEIFSFKKLILGANEKIS